MKVKVKANELLPGTKATHIALVKRGAIRLPFGLVKSDDAAINGNAEGNAPMLHFDLTKLHLFGKSDAPKPSVAAVIVSTKADLTEMTARVKAAGFSVEKSDDSQAGVVVFSQVDGDVGEALIVKMDDYTAVAVTGLAKGLDGYNFTSVEFQDVLAQEGFRPGLGIALQMLDNTFSNIMAKADSADELATLIGAAARDFAAYAEGMAKAIPPTAFKLDMYKAEVKKAEVKPSAVAAAGAAALGAEPAAEDAEAFKLKDKDKDKDKDKEAAKEPEAAAAAAEPAAPAKPGEEPAPAAPAKADADPAEPEAGKPAQTQDLAAIISAALGPVMDELKGFQTALSGVVKTAEEAKATAAEAKAKAEGTDKAVRGAVPGAEPAADRQPAKAEDEDDSEGGIGDTAYQRQDFSPAWGMGHQRAAGGRR